MQPAHLFLLKPFKVVCPDVVPELSEESFVGVVVGVCLRVGHLEVDAALEGEGKRDRRAIKG